MGPSFSSNGNDYPILFAAGHQNYAWCVTDYLNDMYGLPEEVRAKFQQGLHV